MVDSKYEDDIYDWMVQRTLTTGLESTKCDLCEEHSIYVDLFDISYRHMGMGSCFKPLCIYCYYDYVVMPMDEQWAEYHSGLL